MSSETIRLSSEQAQYFYEQIDAVTAGRKSVSNRESVLRLRQIFEQVLKEASRDAREPLADSFKRSIYVLNQTRAPRELIEVAHQFRKLANRCVHEMDFETLTDHVAFGEHTLIRLIEFLSGIARPSPLPAPATLPIAAPARPQRIALLRGVVVPRADDRAPSFVCFVEEPDDIGVITVELDAFWVGARIPPYATVALHDLVQSSADHYRMTPDGLLVLHPDLLISASSLAECFDEAGISHAVYGFNKFKLSDPSHFLVRGSLLSTVFRELVHNPQVTPDEAFRSAARASAFSLAQLGEAYDKQLYSDVKAMCEVLQRTLPQYDAPQKMTEVPLFSATYGLQGRVDGLFFDLSNKRAVVAEVKSGKAPLPTAAPTIPEFADSKGAKVSHLSQAYAYQMLIHSALPNVSHTTDLIYPQDARQAARRVQPSRSASRTLIKARNAIAAFDWALALDESGIVRFLLQKFNGQVSQFAQEDISAVQIMLKAASPLELAYFTAYMGLVAREWLTARIGTTNPDATTSGFSRLWRDDLETKERDFAAIASLEKTSFEPATKTVVFQSRREGGMAPTTIRSNETVLLYRHTGDYKADPLRGLILRGRVTAIHLHDGRVEVQLDDPPLDEMSGLWAIEPTIFDSSYANQFKSLARFLRAPLEKRRIFLGLDEPRTVPQVKEPLRRIPLMSDATTTDLQHKILTDALSARDYFLLQGPPGTGKTSVMVRMLMQHLSAETNENVLLLAFTNRAVDEICAAIEGVCDFVKIGNAANLQNKNYSLDEFTRTHSVRETRAHIKSARVFVATVAGLLGKTDLLAMKKFDTAIVDEASQLLEPHLAGILPFVGRFILIGDEKQLPAVITQSPEQARSTDPALHALGLADENGVTDLRTSLFERLLRVCQRNGWNAYGMLEAQSRMHEKIQSFPSKQFYAGHLKTRSPEQRRPSTLFDVNSSVPIERALAVSRVVFIPTPPQKGVRTNAREAETVARLVDLFHARYASDDATIAAGRIGVITPFRAQISEIRRALSPDMQRRSIEIDTVERYQGGQRDAIIVSFCVNHPVQLPSMQSLNQDKSIDRKLNVALTRAREYMVLVGAPEVLRRDRHYAALLEHIEATGGWVSSLDGDDLDF